MAQVEKDHAVADRYERHFGMSKSDVVAMFSGLHVAKMTESRSALMFGVPDNGVIHSHPTVLKKGLLVFADLNGEPILKMECGNPLVVHISADLEGPGMINGTIISPPPTIVNEITPPPTQVETLITSPSTGYDEIEEALGQPSAQPGVAVAESSVGGAPPIWLYGLPLVLIPFIPHCNCNCNCPPPSTPEPISMIAFAGGAGALAWKKRRKARV